MTMFLDPVVVASRIAQVRKKMEEDDVHVLIVPPSGDLAWLIGYLANPSKLFTGLVITSDKAVLIVSDLEYSSVHQMPEVFKIMRWDVTPYSHVAKLFPPWRDCLNIAVGESMWALHLIEIQNQVSKGTLINWEDASKIVSPLRQSDEN